MRFYSVLPRKNFNTAIKRLLLWAVMVTLAPVAAHSAAEGAVEPDQHETLIVYLSRTQNTQAVAKIIQTATGGDLVALELQTPYPEDYEAIVAQVARENETGYLPPLKTTIKNLQNYQRVFVGFPTWGMQMPPPVKSFLHHNNLQNKTVIPFNTNAGFGVGSGFDDVKKYCQDCDVRQGFSTKGGYEKRGITLAIKAERKQEVQKEVLRWLENLE